MKTILITVVLAACAALEGAAMPTREETERVEPGVRKLMASERAALESGKKTRSEVAAAAMKLADEADTEAAKLLLMKGAFVLYVKDGNLEKAVKTMNTLEKAIADMPPQSVTNMIETALLGVSKKEDGARLYRLFDESKKNAAKAKPPVKDKDHAANDVTKNRASGSYQETIGDYTWSYSIANGGAMIVAEKDRGYPRYGCAVSPKPSGSITIPSVLGGLKVTGIGPYAVSGCPDLTSVRIPSCVSSIGKMAFGENGKLMSFDVDALNAEYSSRNGLLCSKDGTMLMSGVNGSVNIPEGVLTVCDSAFRGCSGLVELKLPASVTDIGTDFWWCRRLRSVSVDEKNKTYKSEKGMLLTKDGRTLVRGGVGNVEIPSGVEKIGRAAFVSCEELTSVSFPSSVKSIGSSAFQFCWGLRSVTIPVGVTVIESATFFGCHGLVSVSIPEGVTRIGSCAFTSCSSLDSLDIPSSVTRIESSALSHCSGLLSIRMHGERPDAEDEIFSKCGKLAAIHVPANAKSWAGMKEWQGIPLVFDAKAETENGSASDAAAQIAKDRTTVQSIIDGMIEVPDADFWLAETELTQGQWEAVMGNNPARHRGADLPVENVSREDCDAFLEKLNQTKEVRASQFDFCLPGRVEWANAARAGSGNETRLIPFVKPGVVGNLLDMAWLKENSAGQTHAVATKAPNAWGFYDMVGNVSEQVIERPGDGCERGYSFMSESNSCRPGLFHSIARNRREACYGLRVAAHIRPECVKWTYEVVDGGVVLGGKGKPAVQKTLSGALVIPATIEGKPVRGIGDKAFEHCGGLTSVTIPEGVTNIAASAFGDCRALKSVTIPSSVKVIGENAFVNCGALKSVSIPRGVTNVGAWAFANCGGLTSCTLPEGLTVINGGAFYNTKMKSVTIPQQVKSIGGGAFARCHGLKTVTIPVGVTNVADGAFGACDELEFLYVDSGNPCYSSRNGMLCSKDGLNLIAGVNGEVTIPNGVTNICPLAFGDLEGLKALTIPASVTSISGNAFKYGAYYCGNLTSVALLGERPNVPDGVFKGCGKLKAIHVPANAKSWAGMKEWQGIPLVFDGEKTAADSKIDKPVSGKNVVAEKFKSCDFLLNKDFKKNAKYYLCLFSASWCGPCRREMPRIAKMYAETLKADPDIELIHFSRDQDDEKAMAWAKEHDVKFPVVKPKGGNPLNLQSRGIPHLFIVKADGTLVEEGHPAKLFCEEKLRALK